MIKNIPKKLNEKNTKRKEDIHVLDGWLTLKKPVLVPGYPNPKNFLEKFTISGNPYVFLTPRFPEIIKSFGSRKSRKHSYS